MSLEKIIKYSLPFFVFVIISRAIDEISFAYYAVPVMCVCFIVCLFISSRFRVEQTTVKIRNVLNNNHPSSLIHLPSSIFLFLIPGLWFLFTSLWSPYPLISATRALYFLLVSIGCISAGILWIRYSGKSIFDLFLPANIIVVLICLFSLLTNIPANSWTGGHGKGFMSFFGHQNLLSSILLFTLPVVFVKIKDKSQKIKGRKVFFFLLLSLNLLVLALTYSRASILSLVFGSIVFLILNKKWKIITYSFGIAILFFFIIYLTPSLNQFADKVIKKDFPEFYSSRMWMWEPSYRAAIEGGLTGLGYGISEPNIKPGSPGDHYEGERFVREKGNSLLALIEESGVIGLVLLIISLFYILRKLCTTQYSQLSIDYSLLTAALASFLLHSQFEAWLVGVGSVQLPLFFVYLGLINNYEVNQPVKNGQSDALSLFLII